MTDLARIQIDLNEIDDRGLTRARASRLSRSVELHDIVEAFEPEDGVRAPAVVEDIDATGQWLFLRVDWDAIDAEETVEPWKAESTRLWLVPVPSESRGLSTSSSAPTYAQVAEPAA